MIKQFDFLRVCYNLVFIHSLHFFATLVLAKTKCVCFLAISRNKAPTAPAPLLLSLNIFNTNLSTSIQEIVLLCIMLKNGQIYFKNLALFTPQDF